jgi:hypothetical protein
MDSRGWTVVRTEREEEGGRGRSPEVILGWILTVLRM